jgi:uncharacterized protein involved in outer membrane biogenesis
LIALSALSFIALWNFDWNRAKPWLEARVQAATGRPFAIRGDLALSWERAPAAQTGWRGMLPWPRLSAQDVHLGNPAGYTAAPELAQAGRIDFVLNPLLLLDRKIAIAGLRLDGALLTLERGHDGTNNWTFAAAAPSGWQLQLKSLVLSGGHVHLVDAVKQADLKIDVDTIAPGGNGGYGIAWKLRGSFNQEAAGGSGRAGALLSLEASDAVYPVQADLRVGKTSIAFKGTVTRPADLAALDMRLSLAGVSMAQLFPLIGVVLPETPPFATEGHLSARLGKSGGDWNYDKFHGSVGSSDLAGSLEFDARPARPLLKGELVSNLLQFRDLAPLIGGDSSSSKAKRGDAHVQPAGKLLPAEAFETGRWTAIDADVQFTGRKILRDQALPIDNLSTSLHLREGVLSLTPLDFGVAGGDLRSNLKLDAHAGPIRAEMKISARRLKLRELFPASKSMQASLGDLNGDASLSATGNSVAGLLGSANGEIKATIRQATISKLLLEEIGLNLGNVALTELTGDKQIRLNCMVSDFAVAHGQMQVRTMVIDTDQSVVLADGRVDLAQERLDLTLRPHSKGMRLISLTAPLHLTGPFSAPSISVDKGVVALKAAGALALAVLTPVAALIPLTSLGKQKDSGCAALLALARGQPVAPPPGPGAAGRGAVAPPVAAR